MLRDAENNRVTDFALAKKVAVQLSAAQEKKRNRLAAEYFGVKASGERTLGELFERRHADLGPDWTTKYGKSRELRRAFWLERLGEGTPLRAINAAAVERVAREAQGEKSERWRQDVLRYLVDSFAYAEKKLKWIDAKHNLSAVTIPAARGRLPTYTTEEAVALVQALAQVHPVGHWCGIVAFQTGRRIGAILALGKEDVQEGEPSIIRFGAGTDKARREGDTPVYGLPHRTDWTRYDYDTAKDWLLEAEKLAGVPHVKKRAWHAYKKVFATLTTGMEGADLQSGTRRETLQARYREDILGPKADVAKALAALLG